jgi:hypothetical protein
MGRSSVYLVSDRSFVRTSDLNRWVCWGCDQQNYALSQVDAFAHSWHSSGCCCADIHSGCCPCLGSISLRRACTNCFPSDLNCFDRKSFLQCIPSSIFNELRCYRAIKSLKRVNRAALQLMLTGDPRVVFFLERERFADPHQIVLLFLCWVVVVFNGVLSAVSPHPSLAWLAQASLAIILSFVSFTQARSMLTETREKVAIGYPFKVHFFVLVSNCTRVETFSGRR